LSATYAFVRVAVSAAFALNHAFIITASPTLAEIHNDSIIARANCSHAIGVFFEIVKLCLLFVLFIEKSC
jgi:hypothetical protein